MTLLSVAGLGVAFGSRTVVDDVSFTLDRGETLALVGESGSGKSLTALSLLQLLPPGAACTGSITLAGDELVGAPEASLRRHRGGTAGIVFQEPMTSLNPLKRIGAPKLYYDKATSQYLLTWHTPHLEGTKEDPERYWASQRTLYVTSKDLKTFSESPKRLFPWEMGTIDVGIRRVGERYYALIKDERYPTPEWTTGKTVRISSSDSLLGPYSLPSLPISPNFREAPMLIPSPDGQAWYLYYEQYPGVSYGLSVALQPNGPWYQVSGYTSVPAWNKYEVPANLRHGCMLPINKAQYDALVAAFGIEK